MGTKVALTYATLVLACLETILYKRLQVGDNAFALYVKENRNGTSTIALYFGNGQLKI